jgi:hypothetical protein
MAFLASRAKIRPGRRFGKCGHEYRRKHRAPHPARRPVRRDGAQPFRSFYGSGKTVCEDLATARGARTGERLEHYVVATHSRPRRSQHLPRDDAASELDDRDWR